MSNKSFKKRGYSDIYSTIAGCIIIVMIIIVVGKYLIYGEYKPVKKETIYKQTKLYSLEDNINTRGSFVLGIGKVNDSLYYYCREIVTEEPLRTKVRDLKASDYDLVEKKDTKEAYIEYKVERNTYKNKKDTRDVDTVVDQYIVTPPDTIKKEYNADLKN